MKPGHKFLLGAAVIVAAVTALIATGVKETGVYFLTPSELAAKSAADPTFVENVGFKVGATDLGACHGSCGGEATSVSSECTIPRTFPREWRNWQTRWI